MRRFPGFLTVVCATSCTLSILAQREHVAPRKSVTCALFDVSVDQNSAAGGSASEQSLTSGGKPNGIADDPDGYVNLRREPTADAPVVAKVKVNEPFSFECKQGETWCTVKLKSGVTGWMHHSRIKLYYTENDLPKGPKQSGEEIDQQTREKGVNYYKVTRAAAHGDKKALKTFFTLGLDGAAAETHITSIEEVVIHLVGDDRFSAFLREQSPQLRRSISDGWELGAFSPFDPKEYFSQHFPKSAKLVFSHGR